MDHITWTTAKPKIPGTYWRRNGERDRPYMMIVLEGPTGLIAWIIEEPVNGEVRWCESQRYNYPIEELVGGGWAGPLGPGGK